MRLSFWLARWCAVRFNTAPLTRRPRRSLPTAISAHVQSLEPRVLLTAVPVGGEFQVNTYTHGNQWTLPQTRQSVARSADGDFVVTWISPGQDGSGYGIYAQRYNAAGVAQGDEFRVNSYTDESQQFSTVAMDAAGNFVVTWTSDRQDGSGYGIFAQRYNAAGVAQGDEFQVNSYTTGHQQFSTVAMDADGDFVVTWTNDFVDEGTRGIYAQRYNAAGVAQGGEFHVSSDTTGHPQYSTVAMDADGDFVITWSSGGALDGNAEGVFAQRYNAAGVAQGGELQVNTYTTSSQRLSTVAMDADGDFVVTWISNHQDGNGYGIYAQRFNAAGVAQGGEFQVNSTTTGNQVYSAVAMDADGDFIVTWNSDGQDGSAEGIFAQQYNIAGAAQGAEFRVNTYTSNRQVFSSVAMDADGDFVVTWTSEFQDGSGEGMYAQRFTVSNDLPVINNQNFSVAENRPVGHVVGTVVASDPNTGQTLTYAITAGNTGNVFAINATTGQITVASATINFEALNQYNLTVQVTDSGAPNALSATATVTINVTDLNEPPVFLAPTTFTIAENRSVGYVVGDVNTVDPEGNTVTYSIVGGDPNVQFAINPTTGVITVAKATINFEATPQFALQVRAQDNGSPANSKTQTITVNITDLNEPPVFVAPTTFTIAENRSVGFVVGDVNTVDPEGNTVTYSLVGGDPNAQFAIDPTTGVITVAKATINFEATPQFLLSVKAQDNGSPANSRTQTIAVNVTNINEAPVFLAPTTFTIRENRPNGTVVGTVVTVDPENNTRTYSITAGNTNNAFAINATTGQITVNNQAALDFETTPQFLLSVKALDDGSPANSRTQTITINLTNAIGARGPASKPAAGSDLATSAGTTGQLSVTTSSAAVPAPKRTEAVTDSKLYSFTLFEPLVIAPTGEDDASL